jgi:beta-mannosidase
LRIALYREGEQRVAAAEEQLELPAHSSCERDAEALLGHFADVSWAYRFGPPGHDLVVASLERDTPAGAEVLAQAFRFPVRRPLWQETSDRLGLSGTLTPGRDRSLTLRLLSRRVAYGVRIHVAGFRPCDDALTLEPGVGRDLVLTPEAPGRGTQTAPGGSGDQDLSVAGTLTALNMRDRVRLAMQELSG